MIYIYSLAFRRNLGSRESTDYRGLTVVPYHLDGSPYEENQERHRSQHLSRKVLQAFRARVITCAL